MNPLTGSLLPRWWKDRGGSTVGGEGCANIVSSFLHYVDWIWTGYRRGVFNSSGPRVFNSPQLSRPSILPLVQRPDPFILICVHTFIFMLVAAPRSSTGPRRRFAGTHKRSRFTGGEQRRECSWMYAFAASHANVRLC